MVPEKLSTETYYKVNKGGTYEFVPVSTAKNDPVLSRQISAASGLYRKVIGEYNTYRQDKASRDAFFKS